MLKTNKIQMVALRCFVGSLNWQDLQTGSEGSIGQPNCTHLDQQATKNAIDIEGMF